MIKLRNIESKLFTSEHAYLCTITELSIDLFSYFDSMCRDELKQGQVPDTEKKMRTVFAPWFRIHVSFHSHVFRTLGSQVFTADCDIFLCLCFGRC